MRHQKIAAGFTAGVLLSASQAAAEVPGPAQIGPGAGDLVRLCSSPHDKTPDEIIEGCTRVIRSTAFHGEAWPYLQRAIAYEKSGHLDLALADMDQVIALAPKQEKVFLPSYYHDRCLFRAEDGKLKDALDDCNRSLELRPREIDTLTLRADIHYRIGDYAAAIADCSSGLSIDAHNASLMYLRGLARAKTGDATGGEADIAAAKAIDPKIGESSSGSGKAP